MSLRLKTRWLQEFQREKKERRKREEREKKKKKKKRERERMVANGITGTVWYGVLLALPQTVT